MQRAGCRLVGRLGAIVDDAAASCNTACQHRLRALEPPPRLTALCSTFNAKTQSLKSSKDGRWIGHISTYSVTQNNANTPVKTHQQKGLIFNRRAWGCSVKGNLGNQGYFRYVTY